MSKNSCNTDPIEPSETWHVIPYDYGMIIKDALFERLYIPQINYWNNRLWSISKQNVAAYAREDEAFNKDENSFVAIFFEGKTFSLLTEDNSLDYVSPFCLELYESDAELTRNMSVVATEITKLKKERYESERFMASLCMFDPAPKYLEKILGEGLTRICHNALKDAGYIVDKLIWPIKEPESLKVFLHRNQSIITAMQERLLLNMITI